MGAAREKLGWNFWGRLFLATVSFAAIFIGIASERSSTIFGGIVGTALFGHLAFLRFREIYPSRRGL
jgi:hypothetical protein